MSHGGQSAPGHVPVLARVALDWLRVREDGVYVDCTVGAGGHAALMAQRTSCGRVIALDRDPLAVETARSRLAAFPQVTVVHANYGDLRKVLAEQGLAKVDGILFDAGMSGMQLDDPSRGFSFQGEGPLDMRMDPGQELTAERYLARVTEPELTRVLSEYGDVRRARRIAASIVRRGSEGRLRTTGDLVDAIREALRIERKIPEEARTVFQAIRIAVNDEYRLLESGLRQAIECLAPFGRLVAISFHSGEDRIVKRVFQEAGSVRRELYPDGRVARTLPAVLDILTPRPVQPSQAERRSNPRARSARLRAAMRRPESSAERT